MKLKMNYFGKVSDITNTTEEDYEFTLTTLKELDLVLKKNYPELVKVNYTIAVNQSFVKPHEILKENDEIALLPPFSGG